MENIEKITVEIEARLKELANIQPQKDPLKYLKTCEKAYKAYYRAKGVARRHPDLEEEILMTPFKDALRIAEEALKEDF